MESTTTGISGLDAQLGGGVPRGTTILLVGDPGNAVSAFSEQFAGGGLDVGDNVLYFEFDRPTSGLRSRIQGFTMNGRGKKADLRIFDGYSAQFGKSGIPPEDQGVVFPMPKQEIGATILKEIQQQTPGRPYRLVVESLSSIVTPENENQVLDFVKRLVFLGHEMGGVHVLSMVKGMHSPLFETKIKHLVGGVLELGLERKGFGIYSYLLITKMLNLPDPIRLLLFKETEKGLWLESTKRVF